MLLIFIFQNKDSIFSLFKNWVNRFFFETSLLTFISWVNTSDIYVWTIKIIRLIYKSDIIINFARLRSLFLLHSDTFVFDLQGSVWYGGLVHCHSTFGILKQCLVSALINIVDWYEGHIQSNYDLLHPTNQSLNFLVVLIHLKSFFKIFQRLWKVLFLFINQSNIGVNIWFIYSYICLIVKFNYS